MKTRFLTTIALVCLMLGAAVAETKELQETKEPTKAAQLLEERIKYPRLVQENDVTGIVEFKLYANENGQISYLPISDDNSLLSKSVQRQIRRMESLVAETMEPGHTELFRLRFEKGSVH